MLRTTIVINSTNNSTINFAAGELTKYLMRMDRELRLEVCDTADTTESSVIKLGLFTDFGIQTLQQNANVLDDEVYVDIHKGQGVIAGLNPRSVLLAVYRFLTEAGCRWIRPGTEGEIIPHTETGSISVSFQEKPSYRHRGICIEGAVSLENVMDTIEWLPKVGLNSYFIQFREGYTFFERWYNHTGNDTTSKENFTVEKAREYTKEVETEISKRGLIYHGVGHGWTCEPFGIPGISWDTVEAEYPPETTQYFALVQDERKMVDNIPLNLNLCYSNPEVRRLMVQCVVDYIKANSNVDILHFWLADGRNNQCECEECKKHSPTDYYVQILNQLDKVLTVNNIDTKIVFLLYFDLLWTPEKYHIENPDRFIMMFAPITRTYSASFVDTNGDDIAPPYQRNQLKMPETIGENLALLRNWKKEFNGDSFDFDYHFMWDHFYDPGNTKTARTIYEDVVNLKKLGLEGLVSCQCQRAYLPTGLGVYTMAQTLWNDRADFNKITEEYFSSAFGKDGDKCFTIMSKLSELFTPPYFRGEIPEAGQELTYKYELVKQVCEEYEVLINQNLSLENTSRRKSWEYLAYHREICLRMAEMMKYRTQKDMENVNRTWKALKEYLYINEDYIQPVFDLYEFLQTFEVMNGFTLKGSVE